MRCDDVSLLLSESAEGPAVLPRGIARHADHCLRCQAEQAQYRKIRRTMLSMRSALVDPGPSMVGEIMLLVRDATGVELGRQGQHSDRRRAAYVAAAATAATAAGAIVLAARSKRAVS